MGKRVVKKATKARTKKPRLTSASREARLAVAQVYWNNDQEYKQAESRRARARDLALVAIGKNETVGPVRDSEGMAHWLTHGEREQVEMSAFTLYDVAKNRMHISDLVKLCTVNVALLKEDCPEIYAKLLKHRSTKRTRHSCLTWSDKKPVAKRKATRS